MISKDERANQAMTQGYVWVQKLWDQYKADVLEINPDGSIKVKEHSYAEPNVYDTFDFHLEPISFL